MLTAALLSLFASILQRSVRRDGQESLNAVRLISPDPVSMNDETTIIGYLRAENSRLVPESHRGPNPSRVYGLYLG